MLWRINGVMMARWTYAFSNGSYNDWHRKYDNIAMIDIDSIECCPDELKKCKEEIKRHKKHIQKLSNQLLDYERIIEEKENEIIIIKNR